MKKEITRSGWLPRERAVESNTPCTHNSSTSQLLGGKGQLSCKQNVCWGVDTYTNLKCMNQ